LARTLVWFVVIILRLLALATPGRGPTLSLDGKLLDIKRSVNAGGSKMRRGGLGKRI